MKMSENSNTPVGSMMRLQVNSSSNNIFLTPVSNSTLRSCTTETNSLPISNSNVRFEQTNDGKVNNTSKENALGVIDSVADLCFKGENLQQLSTNALPPYVPGSPSNVIKADTSSYEFHCCLDCGDTFALKSSLTFHLERRSVLIKFPCATCKSVQIFYNRCVLLSHIRDHSDKDETSDISKAVINPLPRVFMDGLQTEFVNALDEELSSMDDTDTTPPTDLLEFTLNEVDEECGTVQDKSKDEEENRNIIKVKCMDCNEEFNSSEERAQHLTQDDKIPAIVNQCNKCHMVCPSKCFLKAHQRIHLQISPYVCPECGESPSPLWLNFQYHVKFKCFHSARSIGYKCPVCKRLSPSNDSLLKHMELHTEKYAKCDSCPRAYMNVTTFNDHVKLHHSARSPIPKYNMIYKCSLCDIVFLNQAQMLAHRSTHLKEQICEYVYNCMQCGKPLENKTQLFDHIKGAHPKIHKHIIENCGFPKIKRDEPTQVTYRGKVQCLICNATLSNHHIYCAHLAKAHCIQNQPCRYCYMVLNNRRDMIDHGKKHLKKSSFLCLLCNNKRCNDEKQLDSHLVKHMDRIQLSSFCPICNEILITPQEAIDHLREEHMLFEKMGTITKQKNSNSCLEIITCHFCRDSFASETDLVNHLQTKHPVDSLKRPSSSRNEDNGAEPFAKNPRVEGNVCAKCNYHSVEREDFKKHILSHKTNKSTSQCQECGLCFVVEPALVKHLRVVHKINDTQKYIEVEGTNCMPDFENHAEVSSCNSLICSVCFTTFANETTLKTHMRSHGMAFIRAAKSTSSLS